ncbi:branched-chain amino acid ABC transporter permease [Orrella marina]|uniref:Branched-chain amino acid ABC transporter permease n=1 Tax=Orrella marina TaxID=2163011 RepID=A0A2R4XGS0_9BURK|nr:branched-chain amino acid ABC transporter permease [Orrella marina]AWB32995.1 branched-chain amino acid ABC transporter permease [Orrella marina]
MRLYLLSTVCALVALWAGTAFTWLTTPIIFGLTYAIAALGVSVMVRAGQVSFGHAMYACISAYVVAFIARAYPGTDALVLILAGVVAATLTSALIGLFMVRYRGIFFGMLNLAFSMVLFALLSKLYHITGGTDGINITRPPLAGVAMNRDTYEQWLLIMSLALSLFLAVWVQRYFRSGSGQALSAIKTNETRLEYLGFSAYFIMWKGYVFSGLIVGFSGAMLALLQGLVTPEIGLWLRSGEYVFIVILGGAAHAAGAFLGAAVFETVKLMSSAYFPDLWQLFLGLSLIIVIFLVPNGIVGKFIEYNREKSRRKI